MAELSKTYNPTEVETITRKAWLDEKLFHAEPTNPGTPDAIVIPPPNVTAALHLGHALNNTLQDILTRHHRMLGNNTCWFPGTDHAGIATQTVVEKRVLAEEGKRRTEFKREDFVAKIQAWKDEYEKRITDQLVAMGCSCDYDRQAFTMDEPRARAVREAFFRLFKDGLIYRGKRLVNWDPVTQTALADDEVEMEEIDGHFYYLRYPIVDQGPSSAQGTEPGRAAPDRADTARLSHSHQGYVTVATTRPETMLGDTAVAINPKDPRAAQLRGKFVRLPIVNRIIPIIEDDYVVLPDPKSDDPKAQFATGFLKVTPAHDPNDYEIGQRHNLPLINVFSPTATISKDHGWPEPDFANGDDELRNLLGMDRFEARSAIVEWFKSEKLLEEIKPYRHSVGHSYRSHVPIEPYLSDQWYVATRKQIPSLPDEGKIEGTDLAKNSLAGMALRALSGSGTGFQPVKNHGLKTHATKSWQGQLKIVPERYSKTYQAWNQNIRDWCISRQLWWGHRIPVWILQLDAIEGQPIPPARFAALDNMLHDIFQVAGLPNTISTRQNYDHHQLIICSLNEESDRLLLNLRDFWDIGLKPVGTSKPAPLWVRSDERVTELANPFTSLFISLDQDPDVLDTWFSSGLWPLSTMNWPDDSALSTQHSPLNTWNPTSVLCTAREIITLWVSRMVMFNLYFLNRLPFNDVFVHAMIQDGEGRKMSKSLGNGVDPIDIIESHGADAMRFTLCAMTTHTQDVRMPVERDEKTGKNTSPKFDNGRNFCNKLWNAGRFALSNLQSISPSPGTPGEGRGEGWADRWILSRFAKTVKEANEALANYRFDAYAKGCYDFFWGDVCDWYLEAIKPAMKDPNRAPQTAEVLTTILDGSLRLMHPMIPFITEMLWWRLNEVRPSRPHSSKRLITASWPQPTQIDEGAEHVFPKIQGVISAIRNLRNDMKVDPKKKVTVSIAPPETDAVKVTEQCREIIELLAGCTIKTVQMKLAQPSNSTRTTANDGACEIFVEGLVDQATEAERTGKRKQELEKKREALKARLANPGYASKAPPHLVKQTQDELRDVEAELAKLG